MSTEEILSDLKREAFSGDLIKASTEKLNGYAAALCHSQAFAAFGSHEFPQVCETVRIHLLRAHIESLQSHVVRLHDHITKLNDSNTKLQKLVAVLTVASLLGTAAQIWFAYKADRKAETESKSTEQQLQTPTTQSAAPIQAVVPSSGQAKRKAP